MFRGECWGGGWKVPRTQWDIRRDGDSPTWKKPQNQDKTKQNVCPTCRADSLSEDGGK